MSDTTDPRPAAFVLAGAFRVILRNPMLVTELTERGLAVLVLTPEATRGQAERAAADPALPPIADLAYVAGDMTVESSFNAAAVAAVADWERRYRITGVYAMEETLVEAAGLLGDRLGVPAPGLRASRACRGKYLQRFYLDRFSPRSLAVPPGRRDAAPLEELPYPVVVKPSGRHASSGVVVCRDATEAAERVSAFPEHETVMVEQRVVGREYSVESLIQGGEVRFSSVTAKATNEERGTGFVELAHTVPSEPAPIGDGDVRAVLEAANRGVLERLEYADGVTHSEWRVTDAGEAHLMEIASRTPGDGITLLYGLACGSPLEAQIIAIACGEPVDYGPPRRVARQVYLEHRPGVLRDVVLDWPGVAPVWLGPASVWPSLEPSKPGDPPSLKAVLVLQDRGTELRALRSSDDRAVTFFIEADTAAELDDLERRVRSSLAVVAEPLDGGPR